MSEENIIQSAIVYDNAIHWEPEEAHVEVCVHLAALNARGLDGGWLKGIIENAVKDVPVIPKYTHEWKKTSVGDDCLLSRTGSGFMEGIYTRHSDPNGRQFWIWGWSTEAIASYSETDLRDKVLLSLKIAPKEVKQ